MSQENAKVVQAVFDAWNAGDMDAVRELYHPDVIVRPADPWPEPGPFVGREAVLRQWDQQRDVFEADDLVILDHSVDVGDRVAVRFIWHGAGRGPDTDIELTGVSTIREGRVFDQEFFWDHTQALETLGVAE